MQGIPASKTAPSSANLQFLLGARLPLTKQNKRLGRSLLPRAGHCAGLKKKRPLYSERRPNSKIKLPVYYYKVGNAKFLVITGRGAYGNCVSQGYHIPSDRAIFFKIGFLGQSGRRVISNFRKKN